MLATRALLERKIASGRFVAKVCRATKRAAGPRGYPRDRSLADARSLTIPEKLAACSRGTLLTAIPDAEARATPRAAVLPLPYRSGKAEQHTHTERLWVC